MLIDTQYISSTNKLVCSYVNNAGQIKLKYFDFPTPLKYVTCAHDDPTRHPTYKSWDGKPVKQIENNRPDRYAIYEFLDQQDEKTKSELFDFAVPKIYFVDIETEIVDGFPEAETALTRVLSISVVYDDKIILLGLEDMPQDMQDRIREKTNKYFEKDGVRAFHF